MKNGSIDQVVALPSGKATYRYIVSEPVHYAYAPWDLSFNCDELRASLMMPRTEFWGAYEQEPASDSQPADRAR